MTPVALKLDRPSLKRLSEYPFRLDWLTNLNQAPTSFRTDVRRAHVGCAGIDRANALDLSACEIERLHAGGGFPSQRVSQGLLPKGHGSHLRCQQGAWRSAASAKPMARAGWPSSIARLLFLMRTYES